MADGDADLAARARTGDRAALATPPLPRPLDHEVKLGVAVDLEMLDADGMHTRFDIDDGLILRRPVPGPIADDFTPIQKHSDPVVRHCSHSPFPRRNSRPGSRHCREMIGGDIWGRRAVVPYIIN